MAFELDAALFQRGNDLDVNPSNAPAEDNHHAGPATAGADLAGNTSEDHFIIREGRVFAGTHLLVDLWGASHLDDRHHVDATLRACVERAGASLLHVHLHNFSPMGLSGVAVLAESHISIHTWPERNYAALDVFMCGDAEPHKAVEVLQERFRPAVTEVGTFYRGDVTGEGGISGGGARFARTPGGAAE